MKGLNDVRIRIQCENHYDHAKIIPIGSFLKSAGSIEVDWVPAENPEADRVLKLYFARRIGEVICGNSDAYIYKAGDRSPIGRCALCNGALSFEIQEWDGKEYQTPARESGGGDGPTQI
jgi:hypothetical protein